MKRAVLLGPLGLAAAALTPPLWAAPKGPAKPSLRRAQTEEAAPPPPAPPAQFPPATGPAEEPSRWGDRTLAGHTFLLPSFLDSAFVTTSLGLQARAIFFTMPDVPTDFGLLSLDATTVDQSLDFALKLSDAVGLSATVAGRALVGTNARSLVYVGANWNYAATLGAIVRVARIESSGTQIALRAAGSYSSGQVATLIPLFAAPTATVTLENIVRGNAGPLVTTPARTFTYGGSVDAAQAISSLFGLQASIGLGGSSLTLEPFEVATGDRVDQTTNGVNFRLGAAFTADFEPKGFPLAAMAEYAAIRSPSSFDLLNSSELNTVHTLAAGVFYSGRRDLQLGLEGALRLGLAPIETRSGTSGRPRAFLGDLVFRYFW
jgi:hypothetical protein